MSQKVTKLIHRAGTRGHANHGWLDSHHTFSFAGYYDPARIRFGTLRVLNDDRIAPGMGFGMHPHDNMEIISIPLSGALQHRDSMGNGTIIRKGEIQVMSAGTGILHSEFNPSLTDEGSFLQIWIFPDTKNVKPRYDQIQLNEELMQNALLQILSPEKKGKGVWIHQNAWFHMGRFEKDKSFTYNKKAEANGLYIFVLNGSFMVEDEELSSRDGMGITGFDLLTFKATGGENELLLMEVPMHISD